MSGNHAISFAGTAPPAHWLIVGGGPSRSLVYRFAHRLAKQPFSAVAAANDGIVACHHHRITPTWVWVSDHVAIERHAARIADLQCEGAKLVTSSLALRHFDDAGLIPDAAFLVEHNAPRHPYVPGRWRRPRYSGLMLVQAVLNFAPGVGTVSLAGFDGYDTALDGPNTEDIIRPFLQSCVDALPAVTFEWLAPPRYDITGPNVVIRSGVTA